MDGYNRAMITMGDNLIAVDIDGHRRMNEYVTLLNLSDGTPFYSSNMDVSCYYNGSEPMRAVEEAMSPTYIPAKGKVEETSGLDQAIIQKNGQEVVVDLKDVRFPNYYQAVLTLTDDTSLLIHIKDVKLMNSKSSIMEQYKERFIDAKQKAQERAKEDIDEFVFSM